MLKSTPTKRYVKTQKNPILFFSNHIEESLLKLKFTIHALTNTKCILKVAT